MAKRKSRKSRKRSFGSMAGMKRCPRKGTRVQVDLNPVSRLLYGKHGAPPNGAKGTVVTVPGMGRYGTCLGGPGGGLVFVKFDNGGTQGVSPYDLKKSR